jgi:predicted deacylase
MLGELMAKIEIGGLTAGSGEKVSGLVPIPGTDVRIPVSIICGEKDGPTVLISAGVHSAEYVGIAALQKFSPTPAELSGNLILIHLMNPSGFEHRTISMVYEDGKNLNSVFPGDKNGSVAEKIASYVVSEFFSQCNFYIDLHSGDSYESLCPMVFTIGKAPPEAVKAARNMAEFVNVPYLVVSEIESGGAYNYAGSIGIPAILIERGKMGAWSEAEALLCINDVQNVLKLLKVLEGLASEPANKPRHLTKTIHIPAPASGMWYPQKTAGDSFVKGEPIGRITDYFGNLIAEPLFDFDGVILYQVESLTLLAGENLIAYGGEPAA